MQTEQYYRLANSTSIGDDIPTQFKVLPLGVVKSTKGDFLVDNESFSLIRKHFKERNLQIPIDYEHQSLKTEAAPAAGWITELILKADGVYGSVRWTDKAREYLTNREYKYTSPVIMVRPNDRKAVQLHSVALTNKPAIDALTPLVNSEVLSTMDANDTSDNIVENIKSLLGLGDEASVQEIMNAIQSLMGNNEELQLTVNALKFEAYTEKVNSSIEVALTEGKLMPHQKEWAFASAMADLDNFMLWCNDSSPVIPIGRLSYPTTATGNGLSRSDELLGLSPDSIRRYRPR